MDKKKRRCIDRPTDIQITNPYVQLITRETKGKREKDKFFARAIKKQILLVQYFAAEVFHLT